MKINKLSQTETKLRMKLKFDTGYVGYSTYNYNDFRYSYWFLSCSIVIGFCPVQVLCSLDLLDAN